MNHVIFELLMIDPNSSYDEVKLAYMKSLRTTHPDKIRQKDLQEANDVVLLLEAWKDYKLNFSNTNIILDALNIDCMNFDGVNFYSKCRCGDEISIPVSEYEKGLLLFKCNTCCLEYEIH